MLIACCLKGPHLHDAVCNVLAVSLLLSFFCLQIETEREIKPLTALVIEMFPRAQLMEWPGLGQGEEEQ